MLPKTNPISHEAFFEIRTYEIDHRKLLTLPALIRLMQEAAMQNVINLKVSIWDLSPHNLSWVLLHQDVHIKKLPKLGDPIRIFTTPAGFVKFYTFRDYYLLDSNDQVLAYSSSKWLLLNTKTRRPSRIPPFLLEFQEQMPPEQDCLKHPHSTTITIEKVHHERQVEVGWHDLDFNQHLNNTIYIRYMLDALPRAVLDKKIPINFNIQFKLEANFQDQLHIEVEQIDEHSFKHRLLQQESNKELAVALSNWK